MLCAKYDYKMDIAVKQDEAFKEGQMQQAIEDAIAFLKEKVPPEKVAKCVKLPLEKVLELQSQLSNTNS